MQKAKNCKMFYHENNRKCNSCSSCSSCSSCNAYKRKKENSTTGYFLIKDYQI